MMTKATRYALVLCTMLIMLVAAVAISIGMSTWQIDRSERQWCETLQLLTSQPVTAPGNPAQNPSREASYKLYEDFVHLKQGFGC